LYLHRRAVDTTTPAGRALFQMMGVFAEFERAMIRERVMAGLMRAKEHHVKLGRPKVAAEVGERVDRPPTRPRNWDSPTDQAGSDDRAVRRRTLSESAAGATKVPPRTRFREWAAINSASDFKNAVNAMTAAAIKQSEE
jgi:resolvase-like protein